jgi:predicted ATPase/DNA-binding CsgD family transcriptional regulator
VGTQNLPYQSTTFVGRESEIADLTTLLHDPSCRLLTLAGPGGIGKTRLAIEAAAHLSHFADGIYFVPLQPITSVDNIPTALASALNFQFQGKSEPIPQLLHLLRDKHLLLLLDNFEHVLDGVELVLQILHNAPQVKLLITSREALNLREEWVRSIRGLDYPIHESARALETYSAIELFVRRVRQVRGNFVLAAEEEDVLRICQMVEGMPLALELAAARTKTLSCAVVASEIQHSIDFLTINVRNLPERHRSMQAVFEWSWQLLKEAEQAAFMKLAVFEGGFTAEAGQAIAGASVATLSALVEKSLLRMDGAGRYQFHDLLRRFALSKLDELPEIREQARDAHCTYFTRFLAQHESSLNGPHPNVSRQGIEGHIANIRAAWIWAVDHKKIGALWQARGALSSFYRFLCWHREAESMFQAAIIALRSARGGRQRTAFLSYLLLDFALFERLLSKFEPALSALHESIAILRQNDDKPALVRALRQLSQVARDHGDFKQAYAYIEESLTLATQIGDETQIHKGRRWLISIIEVFGKYSEARRLVQELQPADQRSGDLFILAHLLQNLGNFEFIQGEYEQTRLHLEGALALFKDVNGRLDGGHTFELLGQLEHAVGNFDAAQRDFQEGLQMARAVGFTRLIGWCLLRGGELACTLGDYETARESFREALDLATAEGEKWKESRAIADLGRVAYLQGNLAEAEMYLNDSLARCREIGFRLGEAQILNVMGHVATARGEFREAGRMFAEALKIGLDIETPPTILETLVGAAELKCQEGGASYAVQLCDWCLQHPALHAATRMEVQNLLGKIPQEFRSEVGVSGWQSADLAIVASDSLMRLNIEQGHASPANQDGLTERELEVLRLLATRRTNREIAAALFISVGTVKTHVHRICGKLGVTSRHQAAPRAVELHLI